jgi:hypothetical protein
MALPSLDPSADPSLELTRSARLHASLRAGHRSTRSCRPSPSSPEAAAATAPEMAVDPRIAAPAGVDAWTSAASSPKPTRPVTAPGDRPDRSAPKSGRAAAKSKRPARKLILDPNAVADIDGLEQEVAVLRASIRQLATNGDMDVHVKVLAELRHQIEALCRALKTQQSLEGSDGDGRAAEMRRVLEELDDDLGVAR